MPKPKIHRPHTSRRAPPLKDSDYDHEITLVEADANAASPTDQQPAAESTTSHAVDPAVDATREVSQDSGEGPSTVGASSKTTEPLLPASKSRSSSSRCRRRPSEESNTLSPESTGPNKAADNGELEINIQQPTPFEGPVATMPTQADRARPAPKRAPDAGSAIDVLYENERGGICCGIPLFSSKALGWLDPPPWTNVAHKPSATSIQTAQVPDPSWAWAWPEWRINHQEGADKDGWEYSFNFYRKFSWHGPKWWNSYVRRRPWIRRRVKREQARGSLYGGGGGSLLQPEYFTVRSSAEMQRSSRDLSRPGSRSGSRRGAAAGSIASASLASQAGGGAGSIAEVMAEIGEIRDVDTLLEALRTSRIDREKIEAVEDYLENADDNLARLDEAMHDIMTFFVFQASRRVLLKRLTELCDKADGAVAATDSEKAAADEAAEGRAANLKAALYHANEEVRKLEYWSDVKGIAENKLDEICCELGEELDRKPRPRPRSRPRSRPTDRSSGGSAD